jgi:hypothetical protein
MQRLLLLGLVLPSSAFAQSYSFGGVCPSSVGGSFSIAFDIDPVGVPGRFGQGTTYLITTPNVTLCGTLLYAMEVVDDGAVCSFAPSVTEDFILLGPQFGNPALILSDFDADQFTSTAAPLVIDVSAFEVNSASDLCTSLDPAQGFVNLAVGTAPPPPPTVAVVQRMEFAQTIGSSTYLNLGLPGDARLRTPEAMEASLARPIDRLTDAGCTLDGHLGGAYGPGAFGGEDAGGELLDAQLDRSSKSFQLTLSDGSTSVDGVYNRQMQAFATTGTGGFAVGRFLRSRGANGTFYGVTGTCPATVDVRAVVGDWYRGRFPGED